MPITAVLGPLSLSLLLVGASCGSGGGSTVVIAETCHSDFDCPPDRSCNTQAGQCVAGIVQANHLSGTIRFILGALVPADAGPNTGNLAVSGNLGSERIELSSATGGEIDSADPAVLSIALEGESKTGRIAMALSFPSDFAARAGPFSIDPYVSYATNEHVYFVITRVAGAAPAPTDPVLAYSVGGTGAVVSAASRNGQTLAMTIDAALQPPRSGVLPCISACTSQADCGTATNGVEGIDYPQCFESWDGGPRLCDSWECGGTGTAACRAAGGLCVNALCDQPLCAGLALPTSCNTLTQQNCQVCCNEESQGGETTFERLLFATCACGADAPCASQCTTACASDPKGASACETCVFATGACVSNVMSACAAYPDCSAYLACQSRCPS
jgi:hypothetical protein